MTDYPSNRRSGIMLAHPLEESRLQKWNTPYVLVQPKLDGERCRAMRDGAGKFQLISSEQNIFTSVPHILSELNSLDLPSNVELDGELFSPSLDFSQIHSRVSRKENIHPNYSQIQYHIFDVVNNQRQLERVGTFRELLLNADPEILVPVNTILIPNELPHIEAVMNSYISEGYEGIIVRHPNGLYERKRSTSIMKFKPRKEDTYRIIDCIEEVSQEGHLKGSLGALVLTSDEGTIFKCGSGFSAEQRRELWLLRESLPGLLCKIKYQQLSAKKVPRFPIFAEIIVPFESYDNRITIGERE